MNVKEQEVIIILLLLRKLQLHKSNMPSKKSPVNVDLNWKAVTNANGIESLHGNGYALELKRRFAGIFNGDAW